MSSVSLLTSVSCPYYVCGMVTWLCRVGLASLGSDTVVPAGAGVFNEAPQVLKELTEGHVAGLVDGVIEHGGAPQGGVSPEEDTVDASQALLRWVQRSQVKPLPP